MGRQKKGSFISHHPAAKLGKKIHFSPVSSLSRALYTRFRIKNLTKSSSEGGREACLLPKTSVLRWKSSLLSAGVACGSSIAQVLLVCRSSYGSMD